MPERPKNLGAPSLSVPIALSQKFPPEIRPAIEELLAHLNSAFANSAARHAASAGSQGTVGIHVPPTSKGPPLEINRGRPVILDAGGKINQKADGNKLITLNDLNDVVTCDWLVKRLAICQDETDQASTASSVAPVIGGCVAPQLSVAMSISTGPEALQIVSLAVRGDYAYMVGVDINTGHIHLQIYFTRAPATIKRVADLDTGVIGNAAIWTDVRGRFAYAVTTEPVAGSVRMYIFDVTEPTAPQLISTTTFSSQAHSALGISVEGRFAYVSTFNNITNLNSVALIDVSDPQIPRLVSFADGQILGSTGFGNQALVRGDYVYFCDPNVLPGSAPGFLDIINVSNPSVGGPFIAGSVKLPNHRPSAVWVDGRYAYVVGDNDNDVSSGMSVVDISDPQHPELVSTLPIPSVFPLCGGGIYGIGDHVFISGEPSLLLDVDVSNRNAPKLIATGQDSIPPGNQSTAQPTVQGRYVWTIEKTMGLLAPPNLVAYNIGGFLCEEIETSGLQINGQAAMKALRSDQGDFSQAITCGDILVANGFPVVIQSGAPTTSDIPSGRFRVWQNLASGELRLIANYNGVLKSVLLT